MNTMAKRVLVIVGIVATAGVCYWWGRQEGRHDCIRQMRMAFRTGNKDLAWVTKEMNSQPNAMIDWLTVMIHVGTNAPQWSFGNGKRFNQSEFEEKIRKLGEYGPQGIFIYGEDDATVQQVNLTLDILQAHSVTNILLFTRVQGVMDPPFKMPDGLEIDDIPQVVVPVPSSNPDAGRNHGGAIKSR